jgi:LPXTG-site transpeptidase (sortase) family protein
MRQVAEYYTLVLIGNFFAVVMLLALLIPLPVAMSQSYNQAAVTAPINNAVVAKSGMPNRLVLPSLNIDMPVKRGSFNANSGAWTLSDNEIFYADTSVPANETNGTTLIYGHARWGVFGVLPDVQPGAKLEVYVDTGYKFVYHYASAREVIPTDTSVFTEQGRPMLVLQTCTGPWDNRRALYMFTFTKVVNV